MLRLKNTVPNILYMLKYNIKMVRTGRIEVVSRLYRSPGGTTLKGIRVFICLIKID